MTVGAGPYLQPMTFPHPWRRLEETPHITLTWHVGGPMGRCRHSTQEISLRAGMEQAERRAALLHELEHLRRGPAVVGYVEQDEQDTRTSAARWLIPLPLLADGLVWCQDDVELADHLWVDVATVRTRLATLTPGESDELNWLLDEAEVSFPK